MKKYVIAREDGKYYVDGGLDHEVWSENLQIAYAYTDKREAEMLCEDGEVVVGVEQKTELCEYDDGELDVRCHTLDKQNYDDTAHVTMEGE